MLVREKQYDEAVVTARTLARDFPANKDVAKFLEAHPGTSR
jgi:hypothetical protein